MPKLVTSSSSSAEFLRPCVIAFSLDRESDRARLFWNDLAAVFFHSSRSFSKASFSRRTLKMKYKGQIKMFNWRSQSYRAKDGTGEGSARSSIANDFGLRGFNPLPLSPFFFFGLLSLSFCFSDVPNSDLAIGRCECDDERSNGGAVDGGAINGHFLSPCTCTWFLPTEPFRKAALFGGVRLPF